MWIKNKRLTRTHTPTQTHKIVAVELKLMIYGKKRKNKEKLNIENEINTLHIDNEALNKCTVVIFLTV